jgi:hypothetical protein
MRNRLATGLALWAIGVTFWGCSVTSASPPYPDVQSFCNAKARAECQIAALCNVDANSCQAFRTSQCLTEAADATRSATRRYVADNAQACIDTVNGAYGNGHSQVPFATLVGSGSIADKCGRVFSGNADKGAPCQSDQECASSRVCSAAAPGAMQHVCADPVRKNPGDFCSDPGSTCASDTYCTMQDGGAAQCLPAVQAGQPCGTAPCVSADRCANGFCVARAGQGQACSTSDDCVSMAPYCDSYAGNICTIGLTFATGAIDCSGYRESGTGIGAAADAAGAGSGADAGPGDDAADASGQ